ncbi:MAG: hypothetical protein JO257_12990 [Deltaproteobacteria bacterium]|nr:hypothetical protein [Deltaproteobacteria bacterium]
MIALPFNDLRCLGSITEVVAELVKNQDPLIAEIAEKHPTTESLAAWIRTLPQRDDDGAKHDGPKVEACEPPQRLRIPAPDPNCVERSALYIAVAELIDPEPNRQLATLDTPIGLHTFPIENGAPVILDPRVTRNGLSCGVAMTAPGPVVVDAHDAIEWSARLAEDGAGTAHVRNGASRVRRARNAVMRLVDEGAVPAPSEVDAMGWMFALAEQAARRYGLRALSMVRTTAHAIGEVLDEVLARTQRNFALEIGGLRLEPPPFVSALASVAGRVGLDIGAAALRSKLGALGIGADMFGLVEEELNREGLSMGVLAHPPKLTTFATIASNKAA